MAGTNPDGQANKAAFKEAMGAESTLRKRIDECAASDATEPLKFDAGTPNPSATTRHSAAPSSPSSRRFNRGDEGVPAKLTEVPPAARPDRPRAGGGAPAGPDSH